MKKILIVFLFTPFFSTAQNKPLMAEGISPNLYINHKVVAKENFYSIGRIYSISPREIAPFNTLQLENGLSVGQTLKIPLTGTGFFQRGSAESDEVFVPVYHLVKSNEGLNKIAANHYGLPLETLKQWNNLKGNAVKSGTKLIVGYLKVKPAESYLARNGIGTHIKSNVVASKEENKNTEKGNRKLTAEEAGSPYINPDVFPTVKNPDGKKTEVSNVSKESSESKTTGSAVNGPEGGAFNVLFQSQTNNTEIVDEEANAAVFKSTSGWLDGKYYCLHSIASPGTVIKVTNKENGKFIYAKVLDAVPDIKQNKGLQIIISNAAADVLGVEENNFNCDLSYIK